MTVLINFKQWVFRSCVILYERDFLENPQRIVTVLKKHNYIIYFQSQSLTQFIILIRLIFSFCQLFMFVNFEFCIYVEGSFWCLNIGLKLSPNMYSLMSCTNSLMFVWQWTHGIITHISTILLFWVSFNFATLQ